MSTGVLKAVQLTANGFVTQKRALFKMLMIFHPLSRDSSYKFYDINTVPTGSEPHYTFSVYGKGRDVMNFPEPGVLFDDGIYVEVAVGTTVTVLYEEV